MQTTKDDAASAILEGIASFRGDPPDSDFQLGYLAALEELAERLGLTEASTSQH